MIILVFLLLFFCAPAKASVLGDAAAALSPGQWATIPITASNILDKNGAYTTEFSNKMVYDSVDDRLFFYGGAHDAPCCYSNIVKYDIATNTASFTRYEDPFSTPGFTNLYVPPNAIGSITPGTYPTTWNQPSANCNYSTNPTFCAPSPRLTGHSYQQQTYDPIRKKLMLTEYSLQWQLLWDPATDTFSRKTDIPNDLYGICAFEWFPDINKEFIFCQTNWQLYDPATDTYTNVTPVNYTNYAGLPIADQVAVYSAKDHVIYFGGGNDSFGNFYSNIWKVNASLVVSAIATPPIPVKVTTAGSGGPIAADPASGHLLYWAMPLQSAAPFVAHTYDYNPATNTWSQPGGAVDAAVPFFNNALLTGSGDLGSVAVAMPKYGVIAFLQYNPSVTSHAQLLLFKYADDFQLRCAGPGVVRCFSFDSTADLGTIGFGNNVGMWNNNDANSCNNANDNQRCPEIDNTVSADGVGSLKFTVGPQTNSGGSGQWYANFSSNLATQFGPNSDFYIQWRERHSANHLNTFYWGIGVNDSALTLSTNTVGSGRTATLTGGNTSFIGMTGRTIYVDPFDLTKGLATITSVTDATHATITITTAFTATSYTGGNWSNSFATSGGFKQISVGTGDQTGCPGDATKCFSSCNDLDIPTQNVFQVGYLQSYTGCNNLAWFPNGSISLSAASGTNVTITSSVANFDSNYVGWQIIEQSTAATATITAVTDSTHVIANVVQGPFSSTGPLSGWYVFVKGPYVGFNQVFNNPLYGNQQDIAFQDRASPYCSYLGTHDNPPRTFPPTGNCFGYFPDEWVTYTMHVHVGNYVFGTNTQAWINSHYTLRAARFGQASQIILDQPVIFNGGPQAVNERYGKVWLLPYQTYKDPSQITSTAFVWYDSLIISTQDIPDPSTGGGGGGPTLNPVVMHIGSGKTVRVGNGQVLRSGAN